MLCKRAGTGSLGVLRASGAWGFDVTRSGFDGEGQGSSTNDGATGGIEARALRDAQPSCVAGAGAALTTMGASDITLAGNVNGNAGIVPLGCAHASIQSAGAVNTTGTPTGTAPPTTSLPQSNTIANLGAFTANSPCALLGNSGGWDVTGGVATA